MRQSNLLVTDREALMAARVEIAERFPGGFSFSETSVRLLRKKTRALVDGFFLQSLKERMFEAGGAWWFPEMAASAKTLKRVVEQAAIWLSDYGFFEAASLYHIFSPSDFTGVLTEADFTAFFSCLLNAKKKNLPAKIERWNKSAFCVGANKTLTDCLEESALALETIVREKSGIAAEAQAAESFPHLRTDVLVKIASEFSPCIRLTESGGIACWVCEEAALPADFSERLTLTVEKLEELGLEVSADNLNTALSLHYDFNFAAEFGLKNKSAFKRVVTENYRSSLSRRWYYNNFIFQAASNV